jgi:hypothetical protein
MSLIFSHRDIDLVPTNFSRVPPPIPALSSQQHKERDRQNDERRDYCWHIQNSKRVARKDLNPERMRGREMQRQRENTEPGIEARVEGFCEWQHTNLSVSSQKVRRGAFNDETSFDYNHGKYGQNA